MTDRQKTGRQGEEEACRYLRDLGHTVLERNRRSSHLETDIITVNADGVHFVEVKTRTAPVMAAPEENVDAGKRARMVRAAGSWMRERKEPWLRDREIFFDVIAVVLDGETTTIEYYPQAFIPIYV